MAYIGSRIYPLSSQINHKLMMRIALLLIIVGLFDINNTNGQRNYFKYHDLIAEAETQISREDFQVAITLYDSAFAEVDYVYPKDYLIAAQLAAFLKEKIKCIYYIEKAMLCGLKSYCLKLLNQLNSFLTNEDWQALESKENKFRKDYLASIELDLNYEFSRRYREEQENKTGEFGYEIIRLNYFRIVSLMDSMPFVSDRIIGIDETILDENPDNKGAELHDCDLDNSKVMVTLLHAKDPVSHIGFDRLMSAIELGYLHPRELFYLYDYTPNRGEWDWGIIKFSPRPVLILRYSKSDNQQERQKVDYYRKSIGLCTYEVEQRNIEIARRYKMKLRFGYR